MDLAKSRRDSGVIWRGLEHVVPVKSGDMVEEGADALL